MGVLNIEQSRKIAAAQRKNERHPLEMSLTATNGTDRIWLFAEIERDAMITFQIVLTTTQIATLKAIQEQNDYLERHGLEPGNFVALKQKAGAKAESEYMQIGRELSHYVTSARALIREGLVSWHRERGHVVTEKGRLTLRLIQMDIEETQRQLSELTKPRALPKRKVG